MMPVFVHKLFGNEDLVTEIFVKVFVFILTATFIRPIAVGTYTEYSLNKTVFTISVAVHITAFVTVWVVYTVCIRFFGVEAFI